MKIIFLLTVGLDRPSGLRYAGLARGLARLGHEVTVIALHPDFAHATPRSYNWHGVEIRYVGQMHARKVGSRPSRFGPLGLLQVVLQSTTALALAAAQTEADCLHLGKPQPINGMAALLAGRVRRRPLYLDCDDYEAGSNRFTAEWQRGIFAWWEDYLPHQARGVTVNTTFLAERAVTLGVDPRRIVHVPNGVDLEEFVSAPSAYVDGLRHALGLDGRRVIAYAGTLSLQNHPVDLLLDALPAIQAHEPRVVALLIGGGEDMEYLHQDATRKGIGAAVRFTGHVSRPLLRALLNLAEVSVDPVRDDAVARARSPLKIFESFALGVPVVTADVGDRHTLLDNGQAGELVCGDDPHALARGVINILADPVSARSKGAYARNHVRAYDWDRIARRFARVYE